MGGNDNSIGTAMRIESIHDDSLTRKRRLDDQSVSRGSDPRSVRVNGVDLRWIESRGLQRDGARVPGQALSARSS